MSIRLNGTTGYVELEAPATAGSNTLVLPTGNGTSGQVLSTNGSGALSFVDRMTAAGPAFRASTNTSSPPSFSHNVTTKIPFSVETFDTNGCFDSTTNYRFQPTVAGYYQVNLIANFSIAANKTHYGQLSYKKSGSITQAYFQMYEANPASGQMHGQIADLVQLNGTTDYIEGFFYYYNYTDGSGSTTAGTSTYMSASFVRPL